MMFVQFHPSFDYTDFVEGLRPVDNGAGQIGFERKDGVFKEFCRKAIKNLKDSEKSIEALNKEQSWNDSLQEFVNNAIEHNTTYELTSGGKFTITDINTKTITINNEEDVKNNIFTINIEEIAALLTNDVQLNNVCDIRKFFNRKFGTRADSYTFIITKKIRKMKSSTLSEKTSLVEKKDFVFIIDEINRGEVSKIFGELFYAIDPGYRGCNDCCVQTQYQNLVHETDTFAKGFYVPDNVYILGTMNDIDRSVESMDFAMRRRFTWIEITPEDTQDMLDQLGTELSAEAKERMKHLNEVIAKTDGLGSAYMIGPSYFLKLKDNGGSFENLWSMNIEPLLKEYLRGFRKSEETLNKFKDAYFYNEENNSEQNNDNVNEN